MTEPEATPAGWYPDGVDDQLRWWDGSAWTTHIAPQPTTDTPPAMAFVAERKRVYSHDMLYVTDTAGTKIGRVNLASGKVTMDQPEHRASFDQFVARWRADNPDDLPTANALPHGPAQPADADLPAASGDTTPPDVPAGEERTWRDLAQNRPGQAVRERAVELRAEAPVKTFVARLFGVHTDERAFRVGADGEEEVAWRMRKLGDGWHVVHSIPVGENDSDIDHVVIGPGGVFTLNTKNHPGKKVWVSDKVIMVNGQKTNYLRNSRHEAARASKLLTAACGFAVRAEPIVVIMGAELTIKSHPHDVHVVARREIGKWLQRREPTLSPAGVEAIYEMARRDTTWRPT